MPYLEGLGPGAGFSAGMLTDGRHRLWAGWEADRPVCAAATFIEAGINDVTLVATVPEARRRGYGAALTWGGALGGSTPPPPLFAAPQGGPGYRAQGLPPGFRVPLGVRGRPREQKPGPPFPRP